VQGMAAGGDRLSRASLAAAVESGGFGPQLSALVGLLGGADHLSHRRVRSLLDQVLGVEISTGAINTIRCRLSERLQRMVEEAAEASAMTRWRTWMKPVDRSAMPTARIPSGSGVGCG
jgi:hypothetical protein